LPNQLLGIGAVDAVGDLLREIVALANHLGGQQRIDALDRRDHDGGVLVETSRPEPPNIVEFGKRAARTGRAKVLELVPSLAHQICAIGEKQYTPELRVLQEPMAEDASSVCLTGAGRHLDQRAG
jgi:hypothetical protein